MIGISDRDYVLVRFENFSQEVLAPTCFPWRAALQVEVFQTEERLALELAAGATYEPVELGFRWGPAWSSAWFRLRGEVPASRADRSLALRFSSGTEALLWEADAPRRGFDENRDLYRIADPPCAGRALTFHIEAACNLPLGISTFWWDHEEVRARWREEKPGRLEAAELVQVDERALRARRAYDFLVQTAKALPEESARSRELVRLLRQVTDHCEPEIIDGLLGSAGIEAIEDMLEAALVRAPGSTPRASTCHAVGHAHLDTAWLWPIAETRRKALRSWSNALELMERDADFCFLATQPVQYAWAREDAPELFERVRQRVQEGRWEAGGAMWVEADCLAPSGESLIRQLLVGTRFQRDTFGEAAPQSYLFLPDCFGFPACLPQILRKAGLSTFITDKLAWSERNEFPHTTFLWRGLDGSQVLSHLTPGTNYNAPIFPADLLRGEARLSAKDGGSIGPRRAFLERWLQPFGFGDGGGGPTEETLERARLAARVSPLPDVRLSTVRAFADGLHRDWQASEEPLPVWDGDLYIEQHRGTYTSQAWLKAANAQAERDLRRIEVLLATRLLATGTPEPEPELRARLDAAWKVVLLHQFHDILPGSSIAVVYEEARVAYGQLHEELGALQRGATGAARDEACEPTRYDLTAVLGLAPAPDGVPGEVELHSGAGGLRLRNQHIEVRVTTTGEVLVGKRDDERVVCRHELVLHGDRPRRWDAWNLDYDYCEARQLLRTSDDSPPEVVSGDPALAVVELRLLAGASPIVQRVSLAAGADHVELELEVDWREKHRILRALFHGDLRARRWTSGTQFGYLEHPTHANNAFEEARFEVPGQRWMDLSQPGRGFAVLDEDKLGRSCGVVPLGRRDPEAAGSRGPALGLSLLRSPTHPDPGCDSHVHRIRYAILPHAGDWRAAQVPARAEAFCNPPVPLTLPGGVLGAALARGPFELRSWPAGAVELAAFKPAEEGPGLVLRLVERHGGDARVELRWRGAVAGVRESDLHERCAGTGEDRAESVASGRAPVHDPGAASTQLELRPFEIRTLRIDLPS